VCKKIPAGGGNSFGASASFPKPAIPLPQIADCMGRGCGDASRALTFSLNIINILTTDPVSPPS
jgi:hypothetical protein